MVRVLAASIALLSLMATSAQAQDSVVEEIVVTGMRMIDWDPDEVPVIQLSRRADFVVVNVRVINDTRDGPTRRREIEQTLTSMARGAERSVDIDLSIEDEGVLLPLTQDMVSTLTLGVDGSRTDTSVATLVIKTPIRPQDTLDSATRRIEAFIENADLSGRSLVSVSGEWELSIVNPPQYRGAILGMIAEDARSTSAVFGPEYAVVVEGLSNRVTWRQSGPLQLNLFIPYDMSVTPRP
ncbi:hypothetical protein [Brevundimonas sp.]|uniref:hypothetical protein n=1 Tax=Brevundimonas sp. TaxID=1871086 RepID=UPI003AF94B92